MNSYKLSLFNFFTLILLSTSVNLKAQEPDCDNPTLSQEIDECSLIEFRRTDAELNNSYRNLFKRITSQYDVDTDLGSDLKGKVVQAQRIWIELRDADCEVAAFEVEADKPAHETIKNYCLVEKNKSRIKYLNSIAPD